jgi:hypothetical protein
MDQQFVTNKFFVTPYPQRLTLSLRRPEIEQTRETNAAAMLFAN